MSDYIILTDSCIDLPDALAKELELVILPLKVTIRGKEYQNLLDESEITSNTFYSLLREKEVAITAQANPNEFLSKMKPLLENGLDILSISFSSALSGTYNSSLIAAKERGVEITVFSFTEVDEEYGNVYAYGIKDEKLSKFWGHKLILVTDSKNLVMGSADTEDDQQAIWSQNSAVITIAVNYIILDITLYAQRNNLDVSETVMKLMTEKVDHLDQLIEETKQKKTTSK